MIKKQFLLSKSLLSAALFISLLTSGCGNHKEQTSAPEALPVKLETLEEATLIDTSQFVGTLEAKQRVSLAPRINGRIVEIFTPSGTEVVRGTPIVQLEPTQELEQVNARQAQVQSAKAQVSSAESQLIATQAQRDEAAANLERAKAELKNVQARLALAEVNYKRATFLVGEGVVSKEELDIRTSELGTTQAELAAQQRTIEAQEQALQSAEKSIAIAQSSIEQARSQVVSAEAEVGVVRVDLDNNRIVAPIDGVVGDFPVKVGDYVNIGQQLTTLTNNEAFELRIFVPLGYRSQLSLGTRVEIVDNKGAEVVPGAITFISPTVDQNTQAILTKATFISDGSLKDDQFVTVRIIWNEKPGLLIPTTAVSSLGSQKFVFVAETDPESSTLVAKQKPIEVGAIQGQAYQVISGVEAGDKIAVSRILDLFNDRPIQEESVKSQNN